MITVTKKDIARM